MLIYLFVPGRNNPLCVHPLARQVRDSAQSFLTVHVPLHVSYVYVTAPRGWASLEHHTEMEFSFFYDTVLWRTGILADILPSLTLCLAAFLFLKYCILMVAAFLILLSYIPSKQSHIKCRKETDLWFPRKPDVRRC